MLKKQRYQIKSNPRKNPNFLNMMGAAAYLGICYRRLRALVDAGAIPFRKVGARYLFSTDALDQWAAGSDAPNAGNPGA